MTDQYAQTQEKTCGRPPTCPSESAVRQGTLVITYSYQGDIAVPYLNRERIRGWLEEHNWPISRLAEECSTLGDDTIREGSMRNAVNGIDPMRPGRIRLICKVTAKYGDGIPYHKLAVDEVRRVGAARTPAIRDLRPPAQIVLRTNAALNLPLISVMGAATALGTSRDHVPDGVPLCHTCRLRIGEALAEAHGAHDRWTSP